MLPLVEPLPDEAAAEVLAVELGAAEGDAGAVAGLSAVGAPAGLDESELDESELDESPASGFFAAALV